MLPVPLPCFYRTGVLAPGLLEPLEFGLSTLQVHGSIDLPELGRVGLVILGWDVLDGVADQKEITSYCRKLNNGSTKKIPL